MIGKRKAAILSVFFAAGVLAACADSPTVPVARQAGFDEYGYNDVAGIFVGTGASWSLAKGLPADYLGIYANDKLVMKWNRAWDACNAHGYDDATYCLGAWDINEWNGAFPGGSGTVWHYKTIWVGSLAEASPYWVAGGYSIWGNYEVIMDQGVDPSMGPGHLWLTHATPNGL